ncbi:MAG: DUF3299 domain-containing protein [Pseudomonadota bacterium]
MQWRSEGVAMDRRGFLGLAAASGLVLVASSSIDFTGNGVAEVTTPTTTPVDLDWEHLVPEMTPEQEAALEAEQAALAAQIPYEPDGDDARWLSEIDPLDKVPDSEEEVIAQLSQIPPQIEAPVVTTYDGNRVRLPGYVVPLDFEATHLKTFLLVPYVGACIHVPAPPTNQVVFIESSTPIEFTGLYDPVYVTGVMSTKAEKTQLASAGYRIIADNVRPYE